MSDAKSVLYSPYGGFQLKATYQRNLLMANVVVIVMVAGIMGATRLWGNGYEKTDRLIEVEPYVTLNPFAPPVILKDVPDVKAVRPKHAVREGSVWRPVSDDNFIGESLIYADEEMFAGPEDWAGIGEVQGYLGGTGSIEEYIPPRDTFIVLEKQPEMVEGATPTYPRIARRAGVSGTVWIRALIGKKGKVRLAEVLKASGSVLLDEAAVAAAYRSVFSPGIQNGRPVLVWVTYRVDFVLKD